jgi:uncharacterized protein YecT (DUF1311 family)
MSSHRIAPALLAAALSFLVATGAGAGDVAYSKEYRTCVQASNGSDFAMIDCATAETARWDARLNTAYKKLMATLGPKQRSLLVTAETNWLKFRESNCAYDPDSGTAGRLDASSCFLRMTAERALELAGRIGSN